MELSGGAAVKLPSAHPPAAPKPPALRYARRAITIRASDATTMTSEISPSRPNPASGQSPEPARRHVPGDRLRARQCRGHVHRAEADPLVISLRRAVARGGNDHLT